MNQVELMEATFTLRDVIYIGTGIAYGTWRYVTVKKNQDSHNHRITVLDKEVTDSETQALFQKDVFDNKYEAIRAEMMAIKSELHKRMNTTQQDLRKEIHHLSNGIAKLNGLLEGMNPK